MTSAFAILLALQVASIPPPPPQDPGPERRAAAAALFDRDPYAFENSWGVQIAASRLAGDILTERQANTRDRDARLSARLVEKARAGQSQIIDEAIGCVAEPMAWRLHLPDLAALTAFASSPEGRNFWTFYVGSQPWYDCFKQPVRNYLAPHVEEAFAAVIAETPVE